jgi:glutamyl-tRNA synthetase
MQEHFDETFESIEERLRSDIKTLEPPLKLGQVLMPLRIAVTGSTVSPPILPLIKIIGLEITMKRIEAATSILTD